MLKENLEFESLTFNSFVVELTFAITPVANEVLPIKTFEVSKGEASLTVIITS